MFAKLAVADDANERKANNRSFIRASLPHFVKLQKYLKHFPVHYFSSIWAKSCSILTDFLATELPLRLESFGGCYYYRDIYISGGKSRIEP